MGAIRPTIRGAVLLVGGVAALLAAGRFGLEALLPLSALLLGLVLLGLVSVLLVPRRWEIARQSGARVLDHGATTTTRVRLANRSRVQARDLTWRAVLPAGLGGVRTGAVAVLAPRWSAQSSVEVDVPLTGVVRGRHGLGPLIAEVRDPFGVVVRRRRLLDGSTVVVLPRWVRLQRIAMLTSIGTDRESFRSSGPRGDSEEDVVPRAYQPGDAPKRIDWRTTARRGELMVRQDAPATVGRMAVAVDAGTAAGPAEWALTAAASVMVHLVDQGYALVTVVPGFESRSVAGGRDCLRPALVDLAEVMPQAQEPAVVLGRDARSVVVVLGVVGVQRAQEWIVALGPSTRVWGLIAAESGEAVLQLLRAAGWRVVTWDDADDVGGRWKALDASAGAGVGRAAR